MKRARIILALCSLLVLAALPAHAQSTGLPLPTLSLGIQQASKPQEFSTGLQILMLLTVLTLAPSILIMATCFTRIIVVFHFLKQALGTQQQPPSQILVGLALFLTLFVMGPALTRANSEGIQPYLRSEIPQDTAITRVVAPFREFMFHHAREEDIALFVNIAGQQKPATQADISTFTLIPAFAIGELRIGFTIGFLIFIPFLVIDMIISSVLMSMGMMMLPPQLISMPVKILLFILVDGWHLMVASIVQSVTA
jgi:flagellar biosynthetic protein FliP